MAIVKKLINNLSKKKLNDNLTKPKKNRNKYFTFNERLNAFHSCCACGVFGLKEFCVSKEKKRQQTIIKKEFKKDKNSSI